MGRTGYEQICTEQEKDKKERKRKDMNGIETCGLDGTRKRQRQQTNVTK